MILKGSQHYVPTNPLTRELPLNWLWSTLSVFQSRYAAIDLSTSASAMFAFRERTNELVPYCLPCSINKVDELVTRLQPSNCQPPSRMVAS